jgi:hypothetical protein
VYIRQWRREIPPAARKNFNFLYSCLSPRRRLDMRVLKVPGLT